MHAREKKAKSIDFSILKLMGSSFDVKNILVLKSRINPGERVLEKVVFVSIYCTGLLP